MHEGGQGVGISSTSIWHPPRYYCTVLMLLGFAPTLGIICRSYHFPFLDALSLQCLSLLLGILSQWSEGYHHQLAPAADKRDVPDLSLSYLLFRSAFLKAWPVSLSSAMSVLPCVDEPIRIVIHSNLQSHPAQPWHFVFLFASPLPLPTSSYLARARFSKWSRNDVLDPLFQTPAT